MESAQAQKSSQSLKVLIADDDTPTRILLRAAISQWGYQVVEAKDGEEAWNCMQSESPPNLFILDWLMPKIDGPTLCERSKELHYPHYIILLTQVTGTTNIVKGLEAGADEFLSKPFNMAELRSRLSTGARIIEFENSLAAQYEQMQIYVRQMQNLIEQTLTISTSLKQTCLKDLKSEANVACLEQIETLLNKLEKIVGMIKNIKENAKI